PRQGNPCTPYWGVRIELGNTPTPSAGRPLHPIREEKQVTQQHPARRIAIVTGASRDRGIGAAVCRALARAGADVFFTHWSPYDSTMAWGAEEDAPAQLQEELQALGVRCEHLAVDLATVDAPQYIMDAVEARLGPASILVNNATHD